MNRFVISFVAMAALALAASPLAAQTDTTITYQGSLADQGAPANGSFNLEFSLFDAVSGGAQVGSTIVMNGVTVSDGLLTAELDFGPSAFDNTGRWLEIAVNGNALSPRQPISRSPYSIQTRGIFVSAANKVGIGTSTPTSPLHVEAEPTGFNPVIFGHHTRTNDLAIGVQGLIESTTGIGVYGIATALTGDSTGMQGASNGTSGTGVLGIAAAATGFTEGVYGHSRSTDGRGVYGLADASTGTTYGVLGETFSTSGRGVHGTAKASGGTNYGGWFQSKSSSGRGVFGLADRTSGTNYGGFFESWSSSGRGVYGVATASTGTTFGGRFQSNSTAGRGVHGFATASTGTTYGGFFTSSSSTGRGIYSLASRSSGINYGGWFESRSTSGRALFGLANANSGTNYGVVGHSNSSSGFDFWASGAGTNYGAPSSRRFKSNVVPIGDPLAKLAKLRGVYFDWDDEHGSAHDVGMIAEEVGAVLPEIVQYEDNGIDAIGMDYSKMTPLLVEAVNALRGESNSRLAEKDDEISALRETHAAEINDLRQQLSDLQQIVEQLASNQEKENAQ